MDQMCLAIKALAAVAVGAAEQLEKHRHRPQEHLCLISRVARHRRRVSQWLEQFQRLLKQDHRRKRHRRLRRSEHQRVGIALRGCHRINEVTVGRQLKNQEHRRKEQRSPRDHQHPLTVLDLRKSRRRRDLDHQWSTRSCPSRTT